MSLIAGWGRGTWGEGAWSTPLTVSVTGVAGTTSLGTAVPDTGITVPVTGVSGTGFLSGHSATTISLAVTVVNVGGANKYFIDGVQQPTLELFEGNTYRFDQSDSSNSGHPLRLSETSNGTHGGGSAYTTGVTTNGTPGSSGAYTQITVAVPAPTLYYYCSVHSAMGGQANTPAITSFGLTVGGVSATGSIGNAILGANATFSVSGLSATTALGTGTIAPIASIGVFPTGVLATGSVGEEILWEVIAPSQTPSWSTITASQTPNWTDIAA
tara:strand:+ start:645 stop:1454 length:810 start_codon:yes stop_codon:yes gene_type:complete